MAKLLTLFSPKHQKLLIEGVWNFLALKHKVDLDVTCHGRTPRSAHQLILDVFLPSLKPEPETADRQTNATVDLGFALVDDGDLDLLLEFVYRGQVTVDRQRMQNLMSAAKHLNIQTLVDAIDDCERVDNHSQATAVVVDPQMPEDADVGDGVLHQSECQDAGRRKRKRTPVKFVQLWDGPTSPRCDEAPTLTEPVKKRRGRPPKTKTVEIPAVRTPVGKRASTRSDSASKARSKRAATPAESSEESDVISDDVTDDDEEESEPVNDDDGGVDAPSADPGKTTAKIKLARRRKCVLDDGDTKQARSEYKKMWRQTRPVQTCDFCGYQTRDKIRFNIHSAKHDSSVVVFKCGECSRFFQSRESLERHGLTHPGSQEVYQCSQCSYSSPKKINYHRHITAIHKMAADGKPLRDKYCCTDCSFVCMYKSQYKLHRMMKHSSEKNFKCPHVDCVYASIRKGDLEKHVSIVHLRNRDYMCDFCGFCSTHKGALNRHIRSHSKEKPYRCDTCGQSYADNHKLKTHLRRHLNDEKPFVCHLCGHCCRRKDNLQMHMKRIHKSTLDSEVLA